MSDGTLRERICTVFSNNNPTAFAELKARVTRVVRWKSSSVELDECVQIALIKIAKQWKADAFASVEERSDAGFGGWIDRLVIHTVIDGTRSAEMRLFRSAIAKTEEELHLVQQSRELSMLDPEDQLSARQTAGRLITNLHQWNANVTQAQPALTHAFFQILPALAPQPAKAAQAPPTQSRAALQKQHQRWREAMIDAAKSDFANQQLAIGEIEFYRNFFTQIRQRSAPTIVPSMP